MTANSHSRCTPAHPKDHVLAEIKDRFYTSGPHIRAAKDYGRKRLVKKHEIVGTFEANGRCAITVNCRRLYMSHVAWFLHHGRWPTRRVVYIDGDHRNHAVDNLTYE